MPEEDTLPLFVKGLSFKKGPQGDWEIAQVATNRGKFGLGAEEQLLLDQEVVNRFASYVSATLRPTLEAFLQEEQEQTKQ